MKDPFETLDILLTARKNADSFFTYGQHADPVAQVAVHKQFNERIWDEVMNLADSKEAGEDEH